MSTPSLDQRRAAHAWNAVESFMDANAPRNDKKTRVPNDDAKKYGVHARKLPMRIIASGLGQALAFLVAKGYCPELLKSLSHWCLTKGEGKKSEPNELLIEIIRGNSEDLRRHTAEALAYMQWLVRFVEAAGITGEE